MDRVRYLALIALTVLAALAGAAPASAGIDINHNETFISDED